MPECYAAMKTEKASRYLQQLCKHFAHKVKSEFDEVAGRVEFPPGLCHMTAKDHTLSFYCQSSQLQGVMIMRSVIENHLEQFAWREDCKLEWEMNLPLETPENIRLELASETPASA